MVSELKLPGPEVLGPKEKACFDRKSSYTFRKKRIKDRAVKFIWHSPSLKKANELPKKWFYEELRSAGKSCEEFELMMASLTLEELICLKMELSLLNAPRRRFLGFRLWRCIPIICRVALFNFARIQYSDNIVYIAKFLGIQNKFALKALNYFKYQTNPGGPTAWLYEPNPFTHQRSKDFEACHGPEEARHNPKES